MSETQDRRGFRPHAFAAAAAEEPAGLSRAEETVDGEEVTAGWVVGEASGRRAGALDIGRAVREIEAVYSEVAARR